jgi:hypothetical protein
MSREVIQYSLASAPYAIKYPLATGSRFFGNAPKIATGVTLVKELISIQNSLFL